MKIAFVLADAVLSPTNGVVSQGLTWKKGLEQLGHNVELINMWDKHNWKSYDIILFLGFSVYVRNFIKHLYPVNSNIVVAPILDPNYSINTYKLYVRWGCEKLRLSNVYNALYNVKDKIKLFLVRSEFEKRYLVEGLNISSQQCTVVPLSTGFDSPDIPPITKKDPFCLHISLLMDKRKNVHRLIQAAKKYQFKLVLAGIVRSDEELKRLHSWIGDSSNIEYKGYITEEEKIDLYSRAKVFALPSTNEGVGIVALEAAAFKCEIALTQLGGPKEYYNEMAKLVDPYNIDAIGSAISDFLSNRISFQPQLSEYVLSNFSQKSISKQLEEVLNNNL